MDFINWLFSSFDNPRVNQQWGLLHIAVLLSCIAIILVLAFTVRKKSERFRKNTIAVLVFIILAFELSRRAINIARPSLTNTELGTWKDWLYTLLPRPWCAISCWLLIFSIFVNKKFLYNFASMCALLCAIIFFAYPDAGFNNEIMEFENCYSIGTHALLLITSVSMITLKMTEFRYVRGKELQDTAVMELISYAIILSYSVILIALDIESDPMYFMPGNGVIDVVGLPYPLYLLVYVVFIAFYFNLFYLIQRRADKIYEINNTPRKKGQKRYGKSAKKRK